MFLLFCLFCRLGGSHEPKKVLDIDWKLGPRKCVRMWVRSSDTGKMTISRKIRGKVGSFASGLARGMFFQNVHTVDARCSPVKNGRCEKGIQPKRLEKWNALP